MNFQLSLRIYLNLHIVVDPLEVEGLELLPVREHGDGVSARAGVVRRIGNGDETSKSRLVAAAQITTHLIAGHLEGKGRRE